MSLCHNLTLSTAVSVKFTLPRGADVPVPDERAVSPMIDALAKLSTGVIVLFQMPGSDPPDPLEPEMCWTSIFVSATVSMFWMIHRK